MERHGVASPDRCLLVQEQHFYAVHLSNAWQAVASLSCSFHDRYSNIDFGLKQINSREAQWIYPPRSNRHMNRNVTFSLPYSFVHSTGHVFLLSFVTVWVQSVLVSVQLGCGEKLKFVHQN